MDSNIPALPDGDPSSLGSFPSEILQNVFYFTTATTFFQVIQVNRKFFEIASESRELILHHLRYLPGIKLGLDDRSISTYELFLILRQRAASHLCGVNFTADCHNLEPSLKGGTIFDPRASCLTVESDSCVVFQHICRVRLNLHNNAAYGDTIENPYGDGRARIVQVVQRSYYVSVLYAWTPPEKDPAEDTSHPTATIPQMQEGDTLGANHSRDGLRYRTKRKSPKPRPRSSGIRYHLLHYDLFRSDRPVFFRIPTHKSLRGNGLVPVHLAIHNRLQCAILWDLPDTVLPTSNATVCLYKAEHLPRNEPGHYDVWVIYPFDHPAPDHRPGLQIGNREIVMSESDSDDDVHGDGDRRPFTFTRSYQPSNSGGGRARDSDSDLRFLYFPLKPRSISFFKEGRRLSLYAPGSITPYTTLPADEAIRSRMHPSPSAWPESAGPSWPRSLCRRVRRSNHTSINGHQFTLSTPFFSKHETIVRSAFNNHDPESDDDIIVENDCVTNVLCIGTARIPSFKIPAAGGDTIGAGPEVLTIVQIRVRRPEDDCLHSGYKDDLPPGIPRPLRERRRRRTTNNPNSGHGLDFNVLTVPDVPVDDEHNNEQDEDPSEPEMELISDSDTDDEVRGLLGTEVRVAARLWGWNAQSSSLTGLEIVSVSPKGERIAVALWDRVLIYALNPSALCEEVWDDDNCVDDDSDHGSDSNNDSDSDHESVTTADDQHEDGSVLSTVEDGQTNEAQIAEGDVTMGNDSDLQNTTPAAQIHNSPPEPIPLLAIHSLTPVSAPPASVSSTTSTSMSHLVNYYPHVKDKNFGGSVALLRPIVLKMDLGGVVHKMSWGSGKPPKKDEGKDESSVDEVLQENDAVKQREEMVVDTSGSMREKETQEEGVENDAPDGPRPIVTQAGDDAKRIKECLEASTSETINLQVQLLASLSSASNPPTNTAPEEPPAELTKQTTSNSSSTVGEMPPAQFSDMKLTGQIKHISRRPEYNTAIPLTPGVLPPSPTDIDVDSHLERETKANAQIEVAQSEPKDAAVPDQQQVESKTSASDQARQETTNPCQAEARPAAEAEASKQDRPIKRRHKRKPRKRIAENELVVMTDRGIQVWDLSVWGTGKRVRGELDCGDFFQ